MNFRVWGCSLAIVFSSSAFASTTPDPLKNMTGVGVANFASVSTASLVPGTFSGCVEDPTKITKANSKFLTCKIDGGVFTMTRPGMSDFKMVLTNLMYLEQENIDGTGISKNYYLRGNWEEQIGDAKISSPTSVVVNIDKDGEMSSFIRNQEFGFIQRLIFNK